MSRRVAGELIKLRTTRTALGFAIAIALLSVALVVLSVLAGKPTNPGDKLDAVATGDLVCILLLFLGLVGASGEYRHRTLAPALLVAPGRARLLTARMLAYGLAGLAIGAAMLLVGYGLGIPLLAGRSGPDVATSDYIRAGGGGLIACALCTMLGVGAGTLISKQVPAVIGATMWLFVLEPLVDLVSHDATKFTIGQASGELGGSNTGQLLAWGPALLVMLAWTALFALAAALVDGRRDVS